MFDASDAVQLLLKALFDTELADVVGSAVIGFVVRVLDARLLSFIDAADVANGVARDFTKRVAAKQAGFDFDARKTVVLGGKARHLGVGQTRAQRERFKAARFLHQALEAAPVPRRDVHHFGQRIDRIFQHTGLGRRDFEGVGRIVACQHHAVAVLDQAAVRDDGDNGGAIALGLLGQVFVAHDLQKHQPCHQQAKGQQNHRTDNQDPRAKA